MFQTIKYRECYIHISYIDKKEIIRAQIMDKNKGFILQEVPSIRAAKCYITRHYNKINRIKLGVKSYERTKTLEG
jgi:hypothetical protein